MGAPDFSRSSFTNFASIFSLTVIVPFLLSRLQFGWNSIGLISIVLRGAELDWRRRRRHSQLHLRRKEKAWHLLLAATLSILRALMREKD
jgi:hypothetical protein